LTRILGISAFYHDSAAALIHDGDIIAAAQEERFTRKKHDNSYPRNAISFCLDEAGCMVCDIDYVVFYEKPFLKFERLVETYATFAPKGFQSFRVAMPIWIKEKLFQKKMLLNELASHEGGFENPEKLLFSEHHLSHAASAFYPSPFERAVVLTLDGVGEWATTTISIGQGNDLKIKKEIYFPHSLGLLYSAFTYYIGFRVNSGEYKVMGLAPYGTPRFKDLILDNLIDLKTDGTFRMDMSYFNYCTGLTMTSKKFSDLFGEPVRQPDTDPLTDFHMDVAASIQAVTEEVVLRLTRSIRSEFGIPNLCLAGGVALNCVANGRILRESGFDNIWIQPAAGDAGGALGAAYLAWHHELNNPRQPASKDAMKGSFLGPDFEQSSIEERLRTTGAVFDVLTEEEITGRTAEVLSEGCAVGWFNGRMEFGPRALGARSILGDPRSPAMQKLLNLKVKYRESFRPFAPSVIREDVSDWFDLDRDSPYMLIVAQVRKDRQLKMTAEQNRLFGIDKLNVPRSQIPSVTHVDYSARIQTVHRETNPRYHDLITAFKERTNCPVVVNTSFNIRGEPIVCTPEDAFRCFMGTDIEYLVVGQCFLAKDMQTVEARDYKEEFELD